MAVYLLGGAAGSGKTTFLRGLQERSDDWATVNSSALLKEQLGLDAGDYEALQRVDRVLTLQIFSKLLIEHVNHHRTSGVRSHLIFDCHYLTLIQGRVHPGVESNVLSEFDGLILLAASAETILRRLSIDPTRSRGMFTAELSRRDQIAILNSFLARMDEEFGRLATLSNLPTTKIQNENGQFEHALDRFLAFHNSVLGSKT